MKVSEAQKIINDLIVDLIDTCPHCGAKVHIERLWSDYHTLKDRSVEFYIAFRCKPCKKIMIKTCLFRQNKYSDSENLNFEGWTDKFPLTLDHELNNEERKFIPEEVVIDYQEALKCRALDAKRAGCAMFRRALQSSLLILGANHKLDLIKQIESLNNLPTDIKDWAHQIRIFGNWGAHPDKDNLKEVDETDLDEAYDFISKFLLYVFIMPEKVKLSRSKREEKLKKAEQTEE